MLLQFAATRIVAPALGGSEAKQIDLLIEELVSTSKPPIFRESEQTKAPNYDRAARKRVLTARDALFAKGVAAFPQLIKHTGDRRYSYTDHRQTAVAWINMDVGMVCHELIGVQVEVFHRVVRVPPNRLDLRWIPDEKRELSDWWKARQHMSLHDVQLEGVQWALGKTRAWAGGNDVRIRDESVMEMIADLEALVESLENSGNPIPVKLRVPLPD